MTKADFRRKMPISHRLAHSQSTRWQLWWTWAESMNERTHSRSHRVVLRNVVSHARQRHLQTYQSQTVGNESFPFWMLMRAAEVVIHLTIDDLRWWPSVAWIAKHDRRRLRQQGGVPIVQRASFPLGKCDVPKTATLWPGLPGVFEKKKKSSTRSMKCLHVSSRCLQGWSLFQIYKLSLFRSSWNFVELQGAC